MLKITAQSHLSSLHTGSWTWVAVVYVLGAAIVPARGGGGPEQATNIAEIIKSSPLSQG
jgi:hypothetical protein